MAGTVNDPDQIKRRPSSHALQGESLGSLLDLTFAKGADDENVPGVFYEGSRVAVADIDKDSSPVIRCILSI